MAKKLTFKKYHMIIKNGDFVSINAEMAILKNYSPDLDRFQYLINEDIDACFTSYDNGKTFEKRADIPNINQIMPKSLQDCNLLEFTNLKVDSTDDVLLVNEAKKYFCAMQNKYFEIVKYYNLTMWQNIANSGIILTDKDSNIVGLIMPCRITNQNILDCLKY